MHSSLDRCLLWFMYVVTADSFPAPYNRAQLNTLAWSLLMPTVCAVTLCKSVLFCLLPCSVIHDRPVHPCSPEIYWFWYKYLNYIRTYVHMCLYIMYIYVLVQFTYNFLLKVKHLIFTLSQKRNYYDNFLNLKNVYNLINYFRLKFNQLFLDFLKEFLNC